MKKHRVIQWTTGKVGKLALRGILDDPRLELVGVYAYSADKAGKDAGEMCGRPKTGVTSTNDADALVKLGADTVIYTPFMADIEHVVKMLESGADVISTNLFLNYGGVQGEIRDRLEAACRKGGSSLYISGISPGWINALGVLLTNVCRQVDAVEIYETANCTTYESPETWQAMGMGLPKTTPEVLATARAWLLSFYDAVQRMAVALEIKLDDLEFFCEYATTSERVDLGWFVMEKDTNGAVRAGWNGKVGDKTALKFQLCWYLTKKLNQNWEFDYEQYHLVVKGEPGVDVQMKFIPPAHWGNNDWDVMTAMPPVNAIFDIAAARPGVLALKDMGLPGAPVGPWMKA